MDELVHGFYLVEGKFGIHGVNNGRDALGHAGGIAESAHRQARLRPGGLPEGNVDFREALAANAPVVNVMIDTDNLPFDGRSEFGDTRNQLLNDNALREGVHFGQVFFQERFVHDGNVHAARDVLFSKRVAGNHANAKGTEILGSDHIEAGSGARGGVVNSLSREMERHAEVCANNGHARGSGDGSDSRKRPDPIDELAIKSVVQFGAGKAVVGDGQKKSEDMVLPESEVHSRQVPETVNHEARAGKQRQRQSKLDNHKSSAQTLPASGTGR